jgi:ubiquitin-conjugating enzyme E2 Z
MSDSNIITKETISRLVKDIKTIRKTPLIDNGIYYSHDEIDILKGYAMIIGPKDTPYYGGFYFFEIDFPHNYPFSPPKLTYLTNNGHIRFNPNLYTNGKVCISILNTWHGEQWSSCQTITSILLTICSILNNNPLLNEPGITSSHIDIPNYNRIIRFSNLSVAVCDMISKLRLLPQFEIFYSIMKEDFFKNYDNFIDIIDKHLNDETETNKLFIVGFYNLKVLIDYKILKEKIQNCRNTIC